MQENPIYAWSLSTRMGFFLTDFLVLYSACGNFYRNIRHLIMGTLLFGCKYVIYHA